MIHVILTRHFLIRLLTISFFKTPLMYAAENGDVHCVESLLTCPTVEINSKDISLRLYTIIKFKYCLFKCHFDLLILNGINSYCCIGLH